MAVAMAAAAAMAAALASADRQRAGSSAGETRISEGNQVLRSLENLPQTAL
jgi:hypothetical protein